MVTLYAKASIYHAVNSGHLVFGRQLNEDLARPITLEVLDCLEEVPIEPLCIFLGLEGNTTLKRNGGHEIWEPSLKVPVHVNGGGDSEAQGLWVGAGRFQG